MLILRVGDPHIKPNNIDESEGLFNFVKHTATERNVDRIELLGDLFHTHEIIRLSVLEFWDRWLKVLSDTKELVVLVGNHDQSGNVNSDSHALSVFRTLSDKQKNLLIIDKPSNQGVLAYIPYIHDKEHFINAANEQAKLGAKTLVCHGTFTGSKFESGMYAPDGINADLLDFDLILSGHIHSRQRFVTEKGKSVIYPGTAKWDTASDANEEKGLWLVEHNDFTGKILSEEFINTDKVCTPILSFSWKEGEEQPVVPEKSRSTIELIGSSDWVAKEKAKLKNHISITTKITDKIKLKSRKTGGSLEQFVTEHYSGTTVNKDKLLAYMKGLKIV